MSGPSPEEVRAEHKYRGERAREIFAAGTISCGAMRLRVSGSEVRRLRQEVERRRKEREEARVMFERHRSHSYEIAYIRAEA